jgi:hypothetical protein
VFIRVTHDQRGANDGLVPLGDHAAPFLHPRVDDGFLRLPFELPHDHVRRQGDTRENGRDMEIDQPGELIAVLASELSNRHRHGKTSRREMDVMAAAGAVLGESYTPIQIELSS